MKLNLKAVEERVAPLGGRESYDREFIFELLLAYGRSQGNVTRLRNGSLNVANDPATEVAQKNVVSTWGRTQPVAQEDFPSRDHVIAQCNSAIEPPSSRRCDPSTQQSR